MKLTRLHFKKLHPETILSDHLLTNDKIQGYALETRRGDAHARRQLIRFALQIVFDAAKRYENTVVTERELVKAGKLGLMKAVVKYDPSGRVRFETHVNRWICRHMTRSLRERARCNQLNTFYERSFLKSIRGIKRDLVDV